MPKTTTCSDLLSFKGSRARDCFSCTVLIPDCIWESNLQERQVTFFASHKKVSWLLPVLWALLFAHFKQSFVPCSVLIRSQTPNSIRNPRMCSPAVPPSALRIFAATRPGLLPCHAKILHCAIWRYPACSNCPSRWRLLETRYAKFPFGERLLHDRNEILQS